jgi:hypothetical protein
MKERIRKLMLEADRETLLHTDDGSPYLIREFDVEKFAELIVRECVDICYNHPARMPSNNWQGVTVPLDIAQRLEEHFGVEE